MKLVLDTNIFISSFFWGGHPRDIMTRIIDGMDLLFISDEILSEIYDVMLRPKFKINLQYVQNFVHSIEEIAQPIHLMGIVQGVCRDSDDDKILECALLSKSDYIITGDADLLTLKEFRGTKIITAADYIHSCFL